MEHPTIPLSRLLTIGFAN